MTNDSGSLKHDESDPGKGTGSAPDAGDYYSLLFIPRSRVMGFGIFFMAFGGLFVALGLMELWRRGLGADRIVPLFVGAMFIAGGLLYLRAVLGVRVRLSARSLDVWQIVRWVRWPVGDIVRLGHWRKTVRVRARYGPNRSYTVPYLLIQTRDGRRSKFALPQYHGNQPLLDAVSRRTGVPVEPLPDEAPGLAQWQARGTYGA